MTFYSLFQPPLLLLAQTSSWFGYPCDWDLFRDGPGNDGGQIIVMTRPGDVIAGGAGGMGPCNPPQHQPPGGVYTLIIQ